MDSNVLVTGGHGFIGSHLVERLISLGNSVTCLVRPTSNLRWIKRLNVNFATGDLLNPPSLLSAVKDKEIIFHCAAALTGKNQKEYDRTNLLGTINLLEAIKVINPGIKRVVILSSIAATGPSPDKNTHLTERSNCNPVSAYGRSKLKMEEMIKERYSNILPITIIRPPMVYGPRDDKFLMFFKLARLGINFEYPKNRMMNMVYVTDLVKGMIAASLSARAKGETYFILDPHEYKWKTFSSNIAKTLNKRSVSLAIPKPIMMSVATGSELLGKFSRKQTFLTREKIQDFHHPYWLFSSAKARRDFHFETYTPLEDALKETTHWYKSEKWL